MENAFLAINKKYFGIGLKSIDVLIIAQIEEFQRNNCNCYITNKQFSEMFGESESTVKRVIDKLEELNIINRQTTFIAGNGKGNKQRVLSVNSRKYWKVHNEPTNKMEGSNVDNGRFKNDKWKVHSEPIKDNLKENKKITSKQENANALEERRIEDLSDEEANEIIRKLKNKEKYVDIQKQYNLEFGSVTKDFEKQWKQIKSDRAYWAEQEAEKAKRKNATVIDYSKIYAAREQNDKKQREEEKQRQSVFEEILNAF